MIRSTRLRRAIAITRKVDALDITQYCFRSVRDPHR